MHEHVCPLWLGHLIALAPRRLIHDPAKILGPFVSEAMTVLEPGPGVGFFTLDLARLVGPAGKVVAVDVQQAMLDAIRRKADKAKLTDRIELRLAGSGTMNLGDLGATVDFVLAFAMVHEVPDRATFLRELAAAVRPGGRILVAEPILHVTKREFAETLAQAQSAGLRVDTRPAIRLSHAAVLVRDRSADEEVSCPAAAQRAQSMLR
jgi:ubiquinone/menaquinone biosynthesis C-methylase UbiE